MERKALETGAVLFNNHIDFYATKKNGCKIIPKSMCLVTNRLVNHGRVLKVSEERVG